MKREIEVPDYDPTVGLRLLWDEDAVISVSVSDEDVVVKANAAGLVSLARHLLVLAQEQVQVGEHIHLDESNALELASAQLILEKGMFSESTLENE